MFSDSSTTLHAPPVLLNNGADGFEVTEDSPIQLDVIPTAIATADLDGDGILDLALVDGVADTMTILTGDGEGRFFLSQVLP